MSSAADDPVPTPAAPPVAAEEEAASASGMDADGRIPPPQRKQQKGKRPATDLRFHAAVAAAVAVAVAAFSQVGPSFRTLVNFFWPLLVSTGVFLAAVAVLRVISPPQQHADAADKAGFDLMDFVAGGSEGGHEERQDGGGAAAGDEEEKRQAKHRDGRGEERQ